MNQTAILKDATVIRDDRPASSPPTVRLPNNDAQRPVYEEVLMIGGELLVKTSVPNSIWTEYHLYRPLKPGEFTEFFQYVAQRDGVTYVDNQATVADLADVLEQHYKLRQVTLLLAWHAFPFDFKIDADNLALVPFQQSITDFAIQCEVQYA